MGGQRIAIVNDDPDFIDAVTEVLAEDGYEVRGYEGDYASADALAAMEPDLVILDLVLRGGGELASGWDFLLLLREHPRLERIPIIVCSGDVIQLRKREHELERVANAYVLSKPFNLEALETTVATALKSAESEAS